jgi:Transposase and inactivated derivatives
LGESAFLTSKYKKYSKELKQQAVQDYLTGLGSQDYICKKYEIRARSKLQNWIMGIRLL